MATTYYHTVNGLITGQTSSGTRTHFLTDALGSVTRTVDDGGNVKNTYRYKPFGGSLAKSGPNLDPKFLWVGSWGYRTQSTVLLSHYVRARHYSYLHASWNAVDLLWPKEASYAYVQCNPVSRTDPSGFRYHTDCPDCKCSDGTVVQPDPLIGPVTEACDRVRKVFNGTSAAYNCFIKCMTDNGAKQGEIAILLACMYESCFESRIWRVDCSTLNPNCAFGGCGYTNSGVGGGGPCKTTICGKRNKKYTCPPKCKTKEVECWHQVGRDCPGIIVNTLEHELSHCCGSKDDGSEPDAQEIADCIDECYNKK